jgi:hypothetical protein
MLKIPLMGASIITVILLILSSLVNVVGYQTVQSSGQKTLKEDVNKKELLFNTILNVANNREIQKIIFTFQKSKERSFNSDEKFLVFNTPVLTKSQLSHMYYIGLILSKIISKSRIHSITEKYQLNNPGIQKEITTVIEKDAALNGEISQLSNSKCDCEKDNSTDWSFPTICMLLFPIFVIAFALWVTHINTQFVVLIENIGAKLNCFWLS